MTTSYDPPLVVSTTQNHAGSHRLLTPQEQMLPLPRLSRFMQTLLPPVIKDKGSITSSSVGFWLCKIWCARATRKLGSVKLGSKRFIPICSYLCQCRWCGFVGFFNHIPRVVDSHHPPRLSQLICEVDIILNTRRIFNASLAARSGFTPSFCVC